MHRPSAPRLPLAILALAALVLSACARLERMPPTPNLLRDGSGARVLATLPPEQQKPEMDILYVTDRSEVGRSARGPEYGFGRATSMSYGTATVSLDPAPAWDELVRLSGQGEEYRAFGLDMTKVDQVGQVELTPMSLMVVDGQLKRTPEAQTQLDATKANFISLVKSRLDRCAQKDVYLYVHGFNNSFYDAIARSAILWHSIGRQGVFMAYTWPAGYGGPFGYFYDRESGEFTIFHLREMIRTLRARGQNVQQALKLETLMLAAPDLDLEVFSQRFWLENLGAAAKRTVVYFSSEDDAIGLSNWLFGSKTRIGTLSKIPFSPQQVKLIEQMPQIQLVECQVNGFASSHAYVFGNPAAMSDVVAVLRDRKDVGAANGRPLESRGNGTWLLTNEYFADIGKPAR